MNIVDEGREKKQPQLDESDVNAFKLYKTFSVIFFFFYVYMLLMRKYRVKKKQFFIPLKYINM